MSPYSWLAAERIGRVLPQARWHGVFAGAVFKQSGRVSWGLTGRRAEGIADCEDRAAAHGLGPIRWPDPWPTNDLLVARAMVFCAQSAPDEQLLRSFALAAMRLSFLEGVDLGEAEAVLEAGRRAGIDERSLTGAIDDRQVKDALRAETETVLAAGVFGVPTVLAGGELFWGEDRLEDAARAAAAGAPPGAGPATSA